MNSYNDGICYIYEEKLDNLTDFNAKKNSKTLNDLNFICYLAYAEQSKRMQDLDFAERQGRSLSLKIKTRLLEMVKSNHKIVINNNMYDIINMDFDRKKRELYIYLEFVREIG